ncbi:hypothetical protein [Extensimonas vulgaris]|uniref:hypothetical protein n=1 Tax=Extensimonas vulgaris TaxID=1031594 RepID=UPI0013155122|nr:hypothetical protein [Extensimonas vulgaris]
MGQEDGKKWAAAAHSQPTIPKSDRLLGWSGWWWALAGACKPSGIRIQRRAW